MKINSDHVTRLINTILILCVIGIVITPIWFLVDLYLGHVEETRRKEVEVPSLGDEYWAMYNGCHILLDEIRSREARFMDLYLTDYVLANKVNLGTATENERKELEALKSALEEQIKVHDKHVRRYNRDREKLKVSTADLPIKLELKYNKRTHHPIMPEK